MASLEDAVVYPERFVAGTRVDMWRSFTGTAQEIADTLLAEARARGCDVPNVTLEARQVCLEVEIATTYADVFDLLGASSRRR